MNLTERQLKREYPVHFVSQLSELDIENSETQVWLDFEESCDYIQQSAYIDFIEQS